MNKRRIAALIAAIFIPLTYLITIVLALLGSSYTSLFLAISLWASILMLPLVYLAAKFPKDMGEIYDHIVDLAEQGADNMEDTKKKDIKTNDIKKHTKGRK